MARYEIWLADDRGVRKTLLSQAGAFNYQRVLNGPGFFGLSLPLAFDRSLIRKDARVEIWRKSPGKALGLELVGLVREWGSTVDRSGKTTLHVSGPDINHLLERRHVLYDSTASEGYADEEDAGDLLRRLVRENLGSSAVTARDWSGLGVSVESDLTDATLVSLKFAYENVLRTMQEVADLSKKEGYPLWFGLAAITPTSFEFRVRVGQFGVDRTAAGQQVTVGMAFGNLAEPELSIDWMDEATHVTGLGPGRGGSRVTEAVQDDERLDGSALGRVEAVANANNASYVFQVQDAAKAELEARRPVRRFRGRLVQTPGFVYGLHWDLGDKLPWTHLGQQGEAVVRMVAVSVDESGQEQIDARLETEEF